MQNCSKMPVILERTAFAQNGLSPRLQPQLCRLIVDSWKRPSSSSEPLSIQNTALSTSRRTHSAERRPGALPLRKIRDSRAAAPRYRIVIVPLSDCNRIVIGSKRQSGGCTAGSSSCRRIRLRASFACRTFWSWPAGTPMTWSDSYYVNAALMQPMCRRIQMLLLPSVYNRAACSSGEQRPTRVGGRCGSLYRACKQDVFQRADLRWIGSF